MEQISYCNDLDTIKHFTGDSVQLKSWTEGAQNDVGQPVSPSSLPGKQQTSLTS
jgi:hypothetical protein